MNPFIGLIHTVITLYTWVLLAWLILSWLIALGIAPRYHPAVQRINFALFRLTDPLLRPIRRLMPDLGAIDISPVILLLALNFIDRSLFYYF